MIFWWWKKADHGDGSVSYLLVVEKRRTLAGTRIDKETVSPRLGMLGLGKCAIVMAGKCCVMFYSRGIFTFFGVVKHCKVSLLGEFI
jgi:hypothetical protein